MKLIIIIIIIVYFDKKLTARAFVWSQLHENGRNNEMKVFHKAVVR